MKINQWHSYLKIQAPSKIAEDYVQHYRASEVLHIIPVQNDRVIENDLKFQYHHTLQMTIQEDELNKHCVDQKMCITDVPIESKCDRQKNQ